MKSIRILSLLLALVLLCTGCAAGGAAEATPAPDMSDLPLDGGYAYLRVEVLSRDKDAKTLEVKVLDFAGSSAHAHHLSSGMQHALIFHPGNLWYKNW